MCVSVTSLVVVTPARNKEAFIEDTIFSVEGQTRRPDVYVIVDDGSTDSTIEIVRKYDWIYLLSKQDRGF
jgi:biofilm PGA synthesis N-glycosyltransferase PgaC